MSHGRCPDAWWVVIGCTKVHGMAYCAATRGKKKKKKNGANEAGITLVISNVVSCRSEREIPRIRENL